MIKLACVLFLCPSFLLSTEIILFEKTHSHPSKYNCYQNEKLLESTFLNSHYICGSDSGSGLLCCQMQDNTLFSLQKKMERLKALLQFSSEICKYFNDIITISNTSYPHHFDCTFRFEHQHNNMYLYFDLS